MRKHDVRKWLHAILDLLPVILIPVFMIYSHRHTLTERTEVDIQYKYQSNEVNSLDDLIQGNIYEFDLLEFYENNEIGDYLEFEDINAILVNISDVRLNTDLLQYYSTYYINLYIDSGFLTLTNDYYSGNLIELIYPSTQLSDLKLYLTYSNIYDSNLISYYEYFSYTDYNVIESVDVQDTNSDIMSVFMDDFNNAIDKYFNMGNVFNLGGVYQWFNTNIFSGHAPTVIYSIWNIALYELCMDLLFLLYGLFMWFIDMVEKIMDKPFKSIK